MNTAPWLSEKLPWRKMTHCAAKAQQPPRNPAACDNLAIVRSALMRTIITFAMNVCNGSKLDIPLMSHSGGKPDFRITAGVDELPRIRFCA